MLANSYIEKYNKHIPFLPSKKDLNIRKVNGFGKPYMNIYCWEQRIGELRNLSKHLPYVPDEIWCYILKIQMYIEKKDHDSYISWLYSDYSTTCMEGMKLRSRNLYLPNIFGIVFNEGTEIVYMAAQTHIEKNDKKKKLLIENISEKFMFYIIRWFHWLNQVNDNPTNKVYWLNRFLHLIQQLKIKSRYFMTLERVSEKSKNNFRITSYYIHTYYPNYIFNSLTYQDKDFEIFIFDNKYYKKVYSKAMKLRNYKRINLFLHE